MVDGQLFNLLAALAATLRKKTNKPFGGIQVHPMFENVLLESVLTDRQKIVVTGDFFQLPPVTRGNEVFFAFQSDAWKESIEHTVTLTKVFRQKDNG